MNERIRQQLGLDIATSEDHDAVVSFPFIHAVRVVQDDESTRRGFHMGFDGGR